MEELPRQKLCELIGRYGRGLSQEPGRCEGLLRDATRGDYRREVTVLVNALKEGVAAELLSASEGIPITLLLARLTQSLQDHLGLTAEAAHWAVDSWALALGRLSAKDLQSLAVPPGDEAVAPSAVPSAPQAASSMIQPPTVTPTGFPRPRKKRWLVVGGIVLLVCLVVLVGAGLLITHERDQQAEAQRRQAIEEAQRQADEARRLAEAKLRQEQEARRQAEEARKQAELRAEEVRKQAQVDAQRQAEKERRQAELKAEEARRQEEERRRKEQERRASQPQPLELTWRDNAILYTGVLQFRNQKEATMQAKLYDFHTRIFLREYRFTFSRTASSLTLFADVPIEMDSVTPYPHYHKVNVILKKQMNGSWRGENCHSDTCYPVRVEE